MISNSPVNLKPIDNKKIVELKGEFRTGANSYQQIVNLFHLAKEFEGKIIEIDLSKVNWFEGNLSALFLAVAYYAKQEFNTQIRLKHKNIPSDLDVLNRNGLVNKLNGDLNSLCPPDNRLSTVQVEHFNADDADKFANYINLNLLSHRGLANVNLGNKERVANSYYELFDNAGTHGTNEHPIFTCGQYFPNKKELKFSMIDLGAGFLPNIKAYTKGEIHTNKKAIEWAMQRNNSTKNDGVGGDGLPNILTYCLQNKGNIHVASGDCYYKLKKGKCESKKLKQSMVGTVINLTFCCK